jgi:hypothetical protein
MATEPLETDVSYSPCASYQAPVGRLPILGKARAEIDKIRTTIAADLNQMQNNTAAQVDSNYKINEEMEALRQQTSDSTLKIAAEIAALEAKTINDTDQTVADIDALEKKTISETGLLDQKAVTELTQTSDNIPTGLGANIVNTVQGVVEKQKGLFQKQTDGFDRDAEQKLAKIYVDTWSVRATTDTALPDPAGLADLEISEVLAVAKTGINA